LHGRRDPRRDAQVAPGREEAAQEPRRHFVRRLIAAGGEEHGPLFIRLKRDLVGCRVGADVGRRGIEHDRGPARLLVQPEISHHHGVRAGYAAVHYPSARAAHTADFENIGEIAAEIDGRPDRHGCLAIVFERETLIGCVVPNEDVTGYVNRVLLQDQLAIGENVGIGQLDGQERIVVADIGAKQEGLKTVDDDLQI
jgi:hypothetical protein